MSNQVSYILLLGRRWILEKKADKIGCISKHVRLGVNLKLLKKTLSLAIILKNKITCQE